MTLWQQKIAASRREKWMSEVLKTYDPESWLNIDSSRVVIKKFLSWWNNGDYMTGRDGVQIRRCPAITYRGSVCWNVRDILFYEGKRPALLPTILKDSNHSD